MRIPESYYVVPIYSIFRCARSGGAGCPYGIGRNAIRENNLVAKNPELAKEWHHIENEELPPFSSHSIQ